MQTDPASYRPLGVHGARVTDDFTDLAAALRDELLSFRDWKEMSTNAGVDFARQTGITTGGIGDGGNSGLVRCVDFLVSLRQHATALHELVGGQIRNQLQVIMNGMAYGEGGWLKEHTDAPPDGTERVSWILYLTDPGDGEWSEDDGGALRLRDEAGGSARVFPKFNRFAAFRNGDDSHHEVQPVRRKTTWPTCRLALSGWMVS